MLGPSNWYIVQHPLLTYIIIQWYVFEVVLLSRLYSQCNTTIKFRTKCEYEYIRANEIIYSYSVPDIRIYTEYMPNIKQIHTEYAMNIYSSSQFDRIWMSNIFVQKKTNIHIQIQNIRLLIFEYSNNRIYLCYTVCSNTLEAKQHCLRGYKAIFCLLCTYVGKYSEQAGAELCQAQCKLG
jgi:hypothetical protein